MPERVAHGAHAVAVELVSDRPLDDCPGRDGPLERRVGVGYLDGEEHVGPPRVSGPTLSISGYSSASINLLDPIVISAWPTRPSSPTRRLSSTASNASV